MAVNSVYDFTMDTPKGKAAPLSIFRGKVLLIVNVVTMTSFQPFSTKHFIKFLSFTVLDFSCNQFGLQAPGNIFHLFIVHR
uniref:Uncharacterized protein n=1 Tax=Cyprinus carpio carpio TaxID=630221 RepID=A0A9J8B716_CYPCA